MSAINIKTIKLAEISASFIIFTSQLNLLIVFLTASGAQPL
jgi:hypothetical protein